MDHNCDQEFSHAAVTSFIVRVKAKFYYTILFLANTFYLYFLKT